MEEAEKRGASVEELKKIVGFGKAKKGIFEGYLDEGELEIGQVAYLIRSIPTVQEVFDSLITEYRGQLGHLVEM